MKIIISFLVGALSVMAMTSFAVDNDAASSVTSRNDGYYRCYDSQDTSYCPGPQYSRSGRYDTQETGSLSDSNGNSNRRGGCYGPRNCW